MSADFYAPPRGFDPAEWASAVRLAKGTARLLRTLTGREVSPEEIKYAARRWYAEQWVRRVTGRG